MIRSVFDMRLNYKTIFSLRNKQVNCSELFWNNSTSIKLSFTYHVYILISVHSWFHSLFIILCYHYCLEAQDLDAQDPLDLPSGIPIKLPSMSFNMTLSFCKHVFILSYNVSYYTFFGPVMESDISQQALSPFFGKWYIEAKIWVLGVHTLWRRELRIQASCSGWN